jgi:DHA1 family bicyclomycin/chloramphenicol resistance-like MFS transporter
MSDSSPDAGGKGPASPPQQAAASLGESAVPTSLTTSNAPHVQAGEGAHPGWHVLAILSTLMGFASISTDLYLPAMPAIGRVLDADVGTVELTVSGYLIGFSLGQLLWGPVSDRYGRRWPVAVGLVIFVIGSAGCALAGSVWAMIAWRIVQAVGASAGVVLSRAMVRDLYAGSRSAQMLSILITVMAIAPLIGPLVGAQILALAGWHGIFWALVAIGLATLVALLSLPETLPPERRDPAPLSHAVAGYGELIRNRQLLGYAGTGGFFYAGMFAYIAGTPFAYISYHHVAAEHYGLLFAVGIVGIMLANMLNARLVRRFGSDQLLVAGATAAALAGSVLAAITWTGWGGLAALVALLFVFVSATGFIVANSIAGAMAGFPEHAGAVSALVGSIHYGSGIVGSALVGLFADETPWPMGAVIAVASIGSLLCTTLISPSSNPARHSEARR